MIKISSIVSMMALKKLLFIATAVFLFQNIGIAQSTSPSNRWTLNTFTDLDSIMRVTDDRYDTSSTSVLETSMDKRMIGYAKFGIDNDVHECSPYLRYEIVAYVTYMHMDNYPGDFSEVTETKTFIFETDPQNGNPYKESAIFYIHDAYDVNVVISSVTVYDATNTDVTPGTLPSGLPDNIFCEITLDAEQYGFFNTSVYPALFNVTYNSTANTLDFVWDQPQNGETHFELEWTYVSDYNPADGANIASLVPAANLDFTFTNNATMVRLPATYTSYSIPAMYDRGWIVARIRGVGRDFASLDQEIRSIWTFEQPFNAYNHVSEANVSCQITPQQTINWMSSATFAEDGKNKFVASYADGSSRVRQQVTLSSTEHIAIATETFYDHQGRAAVQSLPSPIIKHAGSLDSYESVIKYYPNLNRVTVTEDKFSREDFDKDPVGGDCFPDYKGFSETAPSGLLGGAGRYYSPSNLLKAGAQAFVPDAENYPYTVTQFTPDNTGRIARQSGVGVTHMIGPDHHETQYFYGTPGQIELDRLFGTDAGYNVYYQKNMVLDANGQASVSYVDMAGRTVATSLAGDPPSNLDHLRDSSGNSVPDSPGSTTTITEDLLHKDEDVAPLGLNTVISEDSLSLSVNHGILVSSNQTYTFNYAVEIASFMDECLDGLCFDCQYQLTISVTDRCGNEMLTGGLPYTTFVGDDELNTTCIETHTFGPPSDLETVSLPPGEYTIFKQLKIVESSLDYYTDLYMDTSTCLFTLEDFFEMPDTSACTYTCDDCTARLASMGSLSEYITAHSDEFTTDADVVTLTNFYNYTQAQCDLICKKPSIDNCEVLRKSMLADMSPGGQYATFEPDLVNTNLLISTKPLSILTNNNQLPVKAAAQFSGTGFVDVSPSWRNPQHYLGSGNFEPGYFDQNGERVKVAVTINTDIGVLPNTSNYYLPNVNYPSGVVYEASTNTYWTYPENLLNINDFITAFRPTFAQSLLVYHPEFFAYEWCSGKVYTPSEVPFANSTTGTYNSNEFDYFITNTTYTDAVTLFGPTLDIVTRDPFYTQNTGTLATALTNKLTNFLHIGSTDYNVYQSVYISMHYAGDYSITDPASEMPSDCGSCGITPDLIYDDASWLRLVEFYLSAKTGVITSATFSYCFDVQNEFYFCIGNEDPLPGLGGVSSPCNSSTAHLYHDMVPRFYAPANNQDEALGIETDVDITDPEDLRKVADFEYYKKTGNCPIARDIEALLINLVGEHKLTTTGTVHLLDGNYLTPLLYEFWDGSTQAIDYLPTISTNGMVLTWTPPTSTSLPTCSTPLTLNIPPGLPAYVTFDNIVSVFDIHDIQYTGTYTDFKIRAYVLNTSSEQELIELNGKICIDLTNCPDVFAAQCKITPQAKDILKLMNALSTDGHIDDVSTLGYPLNDYEALIGPELRILLGPGELRWKYNATGPVFELGSAANGTKLTITCTASGGVVAADPAYFKRIYAQGGVVQGGESIDNTFAIDFYQSGSPLPSDVYWQHPITPPTGTIQGYIHYTANGNTVNTIPVTNCEYGVAADCKNPENLNLYQLEDALDLMVYSSTVSEGENNFTDPDGCISNLKLQSTNAAPDFGNIVSILSVEPDETFDMQGMGTTHFIARVEKEGGITDFITGEYCHPIRSCERNCNSDCVPQDSITLVFYGHKDDQYQTNFTYDIDLGPCVGLNPSRHYVASPMTVYDQFEDWADDINANTPYVHAVVEPAGDVAVLKISFPTSILSDDCPCSSDKAITLSKMAAHEYNWEDIGLINANNAAVGYYIGFPANITVPTHSISQDHINCCQPPPPPPCVPTDSVTITFTLGKVAENPNKYIYFPDFNTPCINVGFTDSLFYNPTSMTLTQFGDSMAVLFNQNSNIHATFALPLLKVTLPTSKLGVGCGCDENKSVSFNSATGPNDDGASSQGSAGIHCCAPNGGILPCVTAIDSVKVLYVTALQTVEDNYTLSFSNWLEDCSEAPNSEACEDSLTAIYTRYTTQKLDADSFYIPMLRTMQAECPASSTPPILDFVKCSEEVVPFPPLPPYHNPCADDLIALAWANANNAYAAYIADERARIRRKLRDHCLKEANETFTMTYDLKEYHYTLYYYDQAGNLYRTVPPRAVVPITNGTTLTNITYNRLHDGSGIYPEHADWNEDANKLATEYNFNSLNQPTAQHTPDGGTSHFWYDELGRLIYSQNAKQLAMSSTGHNFYSYTKFDNQGRITEVGQLENADDPLDQATAGDSDLLDAWEPLTLGYKQITRTVYDDNISGFPTATNLRKRVAATAYYEDDLATTPRSASIYSYDVLGNVKVLWQYNDDMPVAHKLKYIFYYYDLVSGKVNYVAYNPFDRDGFIHKYKYDADNRITSVNTLDLENFDNVVDLDWDYWDWDNAEMPIQHLEHAFPYEEDAHYFYYHHGPLARTELGDLKVQGTDYVYTLQGWIKGVNGTSLKPDYEPGEDGSILAINHRWVARDAYSYGLTYFDGDYKPIKTSATFITATPCSTSTGFANTLNYLYNGNIAAMTTTLRDPSNYNIYLPQGLQYTYDQLNRITTSTAYTNLDRATNTWIPETTTPGPGTEHYNSFTYDANGNIMHQLRNGTAGDEALDNLTYNYIPHTNQLDYVADAVSGSTYTDDIESGQTTGNYQYDAIGNLIADATDDINNIDWSVYGKIRGIDRTTADDITFTYGPDGNRVSKLTATRNTYYVRDASGNIMATYTEVGDCFTLDEHPIYGSSRVGVRQKEVCMDEDPGPDPDHILYVWRGYKKYELSNHLGNVLTVISDKRDCATDNDDNVYYEPDILTITDYYAFGSPMASRTVSQEAYRFGFNGKENDSETGTQDYGFRIYNPTLGKFLSVDPLTKNYPWWTPYQFAGNIPIRYIDLDGKETYDPFLDLIINDAVNSFAENENSTKSRVYATAFGVLGSASTMVEGLEYLATNPVQVIKAIPSMFDMSNKGLADKAANYAITMSNKYSDLPGDLPYYAMWGHYGTDIAIALLPIAQEARSLICARYMNTRILTLPEVVIPETLGKLQVADDFVKLLSPLDEFDPMITLYRGTSGTEKGGSILFLTDDIDVAASYSKNGVMEYKVSQYALKQLERDGFLTRGIGKNGPKGKTSMEFKFEGKELVEALNSMAKPSK